MILLQISNSSDLVALKLGELLERLSPEKIDKSMVESTIVKEMIQNLSSEGVMGEITVVNGIHVKDEQLIVSKDFKVRNHQVF